MYKSKKKYDAARVVAVRWVAEKHNVSREYVRAAIYKTSTGGITEELLKDFKAKYEELQKVLS